jgi:two-component system OmpR family response regulator
MARILMIENEEKMVRMRARVLRDEGHVAETSGDGRSGLSRALDDSFDLLIVDWMLPERTGVQVVRALRAADVYAPVLMLTARPPFLSCFAKEPSL